MTVLANRKASFPLLADREIVIEAIKSNRDLLECADASVKDYLELRNFKGVVNGSLYRRIELTWAMNRDP